MLEITNFDYNATTPLLPAARKAWLNASAALIGNASSPHRLGARADAALTRARQQIAGIMGCDPLDIVWTSGATESNNMVFNHFAQVSSDREVWISAIEHPCVLKAAARDFPKHYHLLPVNKSGVVDVTWLEKNLRLRSPGLIAVMAANNETGVLQPWKEILTLCRRFGVSYFCDAAQWFGKLPAAEIGGCDFVSGCAHKFGGPKGVGFLKCPERGRLHPFLVGGSQEEGRRAGTENVTGVLAMAAALECCEKLLAADEQTRRLRWKTSFERKLLQNLPGSRIVGEETSRLWNTTTALLPSIGCQNRWVVKLDKLGFATSTGSACASGHEEPSHVLRAMGCSSEEASRVVRFSGGWETRPSNWNSLLAALVKVQSDAGV